MARATREDGLIGQLRLLLRMAGVRPKRWIAATITVSILLAALDTLGVAAMIPLTQLVSGVEVDGGVLGWVASVVGTSSPSTLIPVVAAAIAIIFVGKSIAAIVFRWWLLGRTTRISALVSTELMRRYVLAPYADHRGRRMSEIYRNINDSTNQSASVLLGIVSLGTDTLMLAAIVTVLAITAPVITLMTVVLFVVFVLGVQRLLRGRQSRIGEEMAEAGLQSWQYLMPALDGFREARLTSSAASFVDGFRASRLRSARAARQMGIIADSPRYVLEIGFIIAIMGISAILFTTGTPQQALTVLGVFAAASLRALPTLNRVSANLATIRTGQVGLGILSRAVAELDAGGTHDERPRGDVRYTGDIVLRDLTYQYPGAERPAVDAVSLVIPENTTTAFVGSSGAGKSTLLDLLLGLLEPSAGTIECGGRPILDDKASWYSNLGVVPQDVILMNDTLAANIAFGLRPADRDSERMREVIAMAQLTDLVAELPDGLDTVIGERGTRLSGGQRQRLGLARALYRAPRVLVLDEATSALDNVTEHEIAETLARLGGRMTIIIVAHRLSTVRGADTLAFLKDGRLQDTGTFAEVRAANADFARLVELGKLD
ncbi:ABC transporter ATP-binding protein [Microbacterium sp. Marseille-Q6648]|uniref:ABC transporter ATP-binding protein n=1 Tax=Microbacterium sp. Marseille-Q6648 TaxID=2937991 RepID=UPI002040FAF2|nr:ABC transporter ATP-binding protein [Microbacterium sp. Marseille-Q6648]